MINAPPAPAAADPVPDTQRLAVAVASARAGAPARAGAGAGAGVVAGAGADIGVDIGVDVGVGADVVAGQRPATPAGTTAAASPGVPVAPRRSRSVAVLALQARAFKHEQLAAAALSVANELGRALGCERVSLGFVHKGRVQVVAVSGTAQVEPRQRLVRALGEALQEAVDQRDTVMHPLPPGVAAVLSPAHAALATRNGGLALCSVPIVGAGGPLSDAEAIGALLLERQAGFDAATVDAAKDAAAFVGPILALKHRLDQPVSGRFVDAVAAGPGASAQQRRRLQLAGAAVLGLLLVALWPATFRIVAPARVEGLGQQVLAAPFDGYVGRVLLRPGASILAGQLLLSLDTREQELEAQRLTAEISQLDKKYREAHSTDDAAQIVLTQSRLAQAQAQMDLLKQQTARAQLLAPFDGVLLAGDLSQSIGAPVKRGQELITVAPGRRFRIVAEVDEQDVAQLREQQTGRALFAALDGPALDLTVTRVAPLAQVLDGRNVFEVDARLVPGPNRPAGEPTAATGPTGATGTTGTTEASATLAAQGQAPTGLRPGLRGVVQIDVAERTLGWIWWHRASQWLRRTSWRLLG